MSIYLGDTIIAGSAIAANKANTSLDNLTTGGKTLASSFSLPSGRYEAITLGSSGDSYTAPANGYYYMYIPAGTNGNTQLIYMENVGKPCMSSTAPGTATGIACTLPVLSGDSVKIYYVIQGTSSTLRFYYADGNPGGN